MAEGQDKRHFMTVELAPGCQGCRLNLETLRSIEEMTNNERNTSTNRGDGKPILRFELDPMYDKEGKFEGWHLGVERESRSTR